MIMQKCAIVSLALLVLSACGQSSNNDSTPAPQPTVSPSPKPEPRPDPTLTPQPFNDTEPVVTSIVSDLEAGALLVTFNSPIKSNGTVSIIINDLAVKHQLTWSEDKTQLRIVLDKKPYATSPIKLILNLEGVNGRSASIVKSLSFVEDKAAPTVLSATQVGLDSLVIVFSEPLSEKTEFFHFPPEISSGPQFSEDRTTLTLPFDRKRTNRFSRFEITSAVDMAGNRVSERLVFSFDVEGPVLEGTDWKEGDILQVKFDEPAILEKSIVTIDGKTIENLGVDRSKPQQFLNIPLTDHGIDRTESHRLAISSLQDVYGNVKERAETGFSRLQDKMPPTITQVTQQQTWTMGGEAYLNFEVQFSERVIDGSQLTVNGLSLSFDGSYSFSQDRRRMRLSIRANRNKIRHESSNTLSIKLVDAMDNSGTSVAEFSADTMPPKVLSEENKSRQIDVRTLRLAFAEADVKDVKVGFWNRDGPGYTLSPLKAEGSHWIMDVTFDRDMPDVNMLIVRVTDDKGNSTDEADRLLGLTLVTESPRFSAVTFSRKNAVSIAMHRPVGSSEDPELIDAEGNVLPKDDYNFQWTHSRTGLHIFFKEDLKAPLSRINLRAVTRNENLALKTDLVAIDDLKFLPDSYLNESYEALSGMKASFVVAATIDPGRIKVFFYDYEDSQNMLKPFDCLISSESYQFQGFNRINLSCPGSGLKGLLIELGSPDDVVYQDIW